MNKQLIILSGLVIACAGNLLAMEGQPDSFVKSPVPSKPISAFRAVIAAQEMPTRMNDREWKQVCHETHVQTFPRLAIFEAILDRSMSATPRPASVVSGDKQFRPVRSVSATPFTPLAQRSMTQLPRLMIETPSISESIVSTPRKTKAPSSARSEASLLWPDQAIERFTSGALPESRLEGWSDDNTPKVSSRRPFILPDGTDLHDISDREAYFRTQKALELLDRSIVHYVYEPEIKWVFSALDGYAKKQQAVVTAAAPR